METPERPRLRWIQHPAPSIGLCLYLIYAIVVLVREKETAMAPTAVNIQAASPSIEHYRFLPKSRNDWSTNAQNSFREVLGELDAWSRKQDLSRSLNSWIAEEAVRQSW